jgi:hypothetical protein
MKSRAPAIDANKKTIRGNVEADGAPCPFICLPRDFARENAEQTSAE